MRASTLLSASSLALLTACGASRLPAASPVTTSAALSDVCAGAAAARAEIEALRTRRLRPDLAGTLAAHRAVLASAHERRAVAPATDPTFANVEADAERRIRAIEQYTDAVTEARLRMDDATIALRAECTSASGGGQKGPPKRATTSSRRLDCERFAQLELSLRPDDAASVRAYTESLPSLTTLNRNTIATAVRGGAELVAKLAAAESDHAAFTRPLDSTAGLEARAQKLFGACGDEPAAPPLVVASNATPRSLTVMVTAKPPGELEKFFTSIAKDAEADDAQLYRGVAMGRFGTGFLVVTRTAREPRAWVMTNRHVVDLASSVTLRLDDGTTLPATIAYVDPTYDVAVLSPRDPERRLTSLGGFDVSRRAPKDGEEVSATGYPGLMGEPSFQLTRGHVSNERLLMYDNPPLSHVQHSAAIDPGSSGGPLLESHGKVVGINAFKATGREGVGIAVPSRALFRAIATAEASGACDADCMKERAVDACLAFASELARREPSVLAIQRMLGERIVSTYGVASHNLLTKTDPNIFSRFKVSPVSTLTEAVARRIVASAGELGGVHPLETCADVRAARLDGGTFVAPIAFAGDTAEVSFVWDGARFRVDDFPLPEPPDESPPPPAKKPATKGAKKK